MLLRCPWLRALPQGLLISAMALSIGCRHKPTTAAAAPPPPAIAPAPPRLAPLHLFLLPPALPPRQPQLRIHRQMQILSAPIR